MITSEVENYPGYEDGIMGPEMMAVFRAQAARFGTEFITDDVTRIDFSERPFKVFVGDEEHLAQTVIVATGATARQLGLESERALHGRGVTYCATCDARLLSRPRGRGRRRRRLGDGGSALPDEVRLEGDDRASPRRVPRVADHDRPRRDHEKIEILTPYVVEEVLGVESGKLTGVRLRNVENGETRDYPTDGLFVAIGHDPTTKLFVDALDHDENGYLITAGKSTETNIPGVFAAGDVQDHVYRQAITAAGSGCAAALDAERFLAESEGHPEAALTAPREHTAPA